MKQAKTICKPTADDFAKYFEEFQIDDQTNMDQEEISSKIPLLKAQDFHSTWIKIQNDHKAKMQDLERRKNLAGQDGGDEANAMSADDRFLLEMNADDEDQFLLDKLFIETGEDVEDLFIAFKYY